jgi:O-antigen/teichoic acid export membrane protein
VNPPDRGRLQGFLNPESLTSLKRHLLAVVDQATVSGTSFVTTVIVGRACGPEELGVYTLGWTLLPLMLGVQWSVITMPYTFLCNTLTGTDRAAYNGSVIVHNGLLTVALMLGLGATAVGLCTTTGQSHLSFLFWALMGAAPFLLLREFGRRFEMAHMKIGTATLLDGTVAGVQILLLLWLAKRDQLTGPSAFLVMGLACAIGGLLFLFLTRGRYAFSRDATARWLRTNLSYGKWVFGARVTTHLRVAFIPWMISLTLDDSVTGAFAACFNIAFLIAPLVLAISNVAAPSASLSYSQHGLPGLRKFVSRTTLFAGTSTFILCMFIVLFGEHLVLYVYGRGFPPHHAAVIMLSLALVAQALQIGPTNGLFAIQRPDLNFIGNLLGLFATIVAATQWIDAWAVFGAAAALTAGVAVETAIKIALFWWAIRGRQDAVVD